MLVRAERSRLRGSLRCLAAVVVLAAVVACSSEDPPRQYSDEELELDEIIDDEMLVAMPWARYRTSEERNRNRPDPTDPAVGSGHERERSYFEFLVGLVMLVAGENLPPDVALGSGVLHDAEDEAMDQCATEAGWPGVQLYDVFNDEVKQYERDYGLTLDQFLDLRHECSKYAATYPTLDPDRREELLAKRRDHYIAALREWMEKNPELGVPVEHHEGDNHPYEAFLIEVCLESEYPVECAREKQVTLP